MNSVPKLYQWNDDIRKAATERGIWIALGLNWPEENRLGNAAPDRLAESIADDIVKRTKLSRESQPPLYSASLPHIATLYRIVTGNSDAQEMAFLRGCLGEVPAEAPAAYKALAGMLRKFREARRRLPVKPACGRIDMIFQSAQHALLERELIKEGVPFAVLAMDEEPRLTYFPASKTGAEIAVGKETVPPEVSKSWAGKENPYTIEQLPLTADSELSTKPHYPRYKKLVEVRKGLAAASDRILEHAWRDAQIDHIVATRPAIACSHEYPGPTKLNSQRFNKVFDSLLNHSIPVVVKIFGCALQTPEFRFCLNSLLGSSAADFCPAPLVSPARTRHGLIVGFSMLDPIFLCLSQTLFPTLNERKTQLFFVSAEITDVPLAGNRPLIDHNLARLDTARRFLNEHMTVIPGYRPEAIFQAMAPKDDIR